MKKCPACKSSILIYDDYFERFKCPNPLCGFMPSSSVERALKRIENSKPLMPTGKITIDNVLGLVISSYYDPVNDSLIFNFNEMEPSIDLPEPDGQMIWNIGKQSKRVIGFEILGVTKLGIDNLKVDIVASRLKQIDDDYRNILKYHDLKGISTRYLIKKIFIQATSSQNDGGNSDKDRILCEGIRNAKKQVDETLV